MEIEGTQPMNQTEASRERYWGELNAEERVERMRRIVQEQQRSISFLRAKVNQLEFRIGNHGHLDGTVVGPLFSGGFGGDLDYSPLLPERNSDEVYF